MLLAIMLIGNTCLVGAQGPPAAPGVANTGTTEDGVRAPVLPGGEEVPTPPAAAPAAPGTANTGTTEGVTASTAVAPAPVEAPAEAPVAASAQAAPAPAPVPAFAGAAPAPAPGAGLPAFAAAAKKGAPAPAPVALLPAAGASQAPAPAPEGAAAVTASLAAPAPAPSNPSCQTGLQGYLQSNPNLTLLTTALNGSTQVSVQNPFTFFAPLDTAFQYIPGDLGISQNEAISLLQSRLVDVLEYHLLQNDYTPAQLVQAGNVTTTLGVLTGTPATLTFSQSEPNAYTAKGQLNKSPATISGPTQVCQALVYTVSQVLGPNYVIQNSTAASSLAEAAAASAPAPLAPNSPVPGTPTTAAAAAGRRRLLFEA